MRLNKRRRGDGDVLFATPSVFTVAV